MVSKKLADNIICAVERGFEDQVRFTQDLVRLPSLRGREHTAQDFIFDTLMGTKRG
jgi:acetylornithine deacetylase